MARIAFMQSEMREFISYMLLSAALKKAGHKVDVFVLEDEFISTQEFISLQEFKPDIVGFSSTTISFEKDIYNAKVIKNTLSPFIIFGGAHPTYNPDETIKNDYVDAICIGEGLDAIVELANNIKNRKSLTKIFKTDIKNLWIKEIRFKEWGRNDLGYFCPPPLNDSYESIAKNPIRPISNINDWPRPDYDLYYKKYPTLANKPTKPVYIVRGCPNNNCAFCYNPAYNKMYKDKGKIFQCMNVEKAIKEIKWLKDNYGFTWLQFLSDNMTINKKWLKEFFNMYKIDITEIGLTCTWALEKGYEKASFKFPIPFFMNCRANEVTKEIVDMLKESGCDRVDFGVEHGNDYIRNDILKRNMSKEQIIQCGKWFKDAGIRVQTTNIFGLPHETFNKAWESVELNRKFKPEISKACILQPFKNTQIYNYAKEKGLLKDIDYSGTTIQIGVKDNRAEQTMIKVKDEKQIIKLSRLFDLFVRWDWIPRWLGYIICSLPFKYKWYYVRIFKRHARIYKGIR